MAHDPPDAFTRTFLLDGDPDLPALRAIRDSEAEARKKRTHRKSRWGCSACKRRKVKCDENAPCSHCEKRRETCSLVGAVGASKPLTPAASPPPPRELDPLADADARVNLLHMELFHHFTQVTIHTLAFGNTWSELVKLAFHEEYLMTAILAVAARHLNILNPSSRRYSDAALILLSKSCSQFRADLDGAITVDNRDTRLATSILLHYLSWCDVSFLDSSTGDEEPLDLSGDQLFLLSGGVRHVRFLSWQLPDLGGSIFGRLMASRNCGVLRSVLEERGRSYYAVRQRIAGLYDDPRFRGGIATPPPEESRGEQGHGDSASVTAAILPPCPQTCTNAYISTLLALRIPDGREQTAADRAVYMRLAFDVAVDRLTPLLHAARLRELDGDAALGPKVRDEMERLVLTFPLLCFGPFCELVAAGDSRALAVLFLVYRSAGELMGGAGCPWWAKTRVVVMEGMLRMELRRQGLLAAVEELVQKAVEDMETEATD